MDRRSLPLSLGLWIVLAFGLASVAVVDQPPMATASHTPAAVPTPWWPPMTPAPTTTVATVVPPTTVPPPAPPTTATPPTTVPPPRPAPATTVAPPPPPAPEPTSVAAAPPATTDPVAYAMSLVRAAVPARWLAAVPVQVQVIPGQTSWSSWGGLIEIGDWHLFHTESRARFTLAHEWGHQAAWAFGPDTYDGEPPRGFPYRGPSPEEQWSDCVGEVLTGASYPSYGLSGCPADARAFASAWLAAGPP